MSDSQFVTYVDHKGQTHPAIICESVGEEVFRTMTLAYFTGDKRALRRGDAHTALRLEYNVPHGTHPSRDRQPEVITEHDSIGHRVHQAPNGLHVGVPKPTTKQTFTGKLVKPGHYWLDLSEQAEPMAIDCDHAQGIEAGKCVTCNKPKPEPKKA